MTLVTGPTHEPDPPGAAIVRITTAKEMMEACLDCLPVDVAICAAAVGDWRIGIPAEQKIKRRGSSRTLELEENADILKHISAQKQNRPTLVVGFAAETENVVENATNKLIAKGCDWIVANDVSNGTKVFGGIDNKVHLIDGSGAEEWPQISKSAVADRLAKKIVSRLKTNDCS